MRPFSFLITAFITIGLVYLLSNPLGKGVPMAVGSFLSPQHGFWQNADPVEMSFDKQLKIPGLKNKVEIYLDERLIPHVFAETDEDLYTAQGYLHARFRLFQMDLQTRAAAGRVSEIAGAPAVDFDRSQRRLGMVYAAENALLEMESDPLSKRVYDAYTRGVNAYIESLTPEEWPVEYKLLNISPEKWSNLRTALLLKMMAKTLTSGVENDLGYSNARNIFSKSEFDQLYQVIPDSLRPIIPKGTFFPAPAVRPVTPASADTLYFAASLTQTTIDKYKPGPENGSNNWVLAGSRTASGFPILANDPHLELTLPSIWFEMQLTDSSGTTYGATLPGSPFIIIGFNDHIAWGITNAQRDVKDYYTIRFRDDKRDAYWYNGAWTPTELRIEEIKVKGASSVIDTVAYTVFGPVMFDKTYQEAGTKGQNLAVRWTAHDKSNEGMTFYKLNRAKDYTGYVESIKTFSCPAQNFVFASRSGDIAAWQQGKFPARWEKQGIFVMPGEDDSYQWQGFIPQNENPHIVNPARGFLESANQRPVDAAYPYYIPGNYMTPRAVSIEKKLEKMPKATVRDMQSLLTDYDNVTARMVCPVLVRHTDAEALTEHGRRYLQLIKDWNYQASPDSEAQTVYQVWIDSLKVVLWNDELSQISPRAPMPDEQVTIELLIRDTSSVFFDNIQTSQKETIRDVVTTALAKASVRLQQAEHEGRLVWSGYKNFTIHHLLKDNLAPFARSGMTVGGHSNIINAITSTHGPSWRMVVHLAEQTEAWGVYPAGQHGNPGSKYYDNFIDTWVKGDMYPLWIMRREEAGSEKAKWKIILNP